MIEINEIMPLYICNRTPECSASPTCGEDECNHTTSPFSAANRESVEVFNKFAELFYVYVDDMGRLNCVEKDGRVEYIFKEEE